MIEIITEQVEMPPIIARRYRMESIDGSSRWIIWDYEGDVKKEQGRGSFKDTSIACLNLNKKHYRDLNQKKK